MNPGSSSSRSPACPCTVNPTEILNIWVESRCAKPLPVPASGQRNFCSHCCCRCRGDECDLCSNRCCVDSHSAHLRIRCSSDHGSRIESTWVARHQGHHAAPERTASIRSGSPKRFAQFVGVLFSATASVLWLLDLGTAARIVAAMLAGAAFLESAFAVCLGCIMFGWLIRWGVVPERICEQCNNLNLRTTPSA